MSRWSKIGAVLGGYLLAFAAAVVAAWRYDVRVSSLPYDTSGGMYAGGQAMTALAAFLVVALLPTSLALWFLRRHAPFWNGVGVLSLAFAVVGLVAVLSPLVFRGPPTTIPHALLGLVQLAQLLGMPLWIAAFVIFALLAPTRPARRLLVSAIAVEVVIAACALVHWFVPSPPL